MHRAWDPCQELPTVTQGAAELGTCTLGGPCPEHLGLWHQKAAPAPVSSLIPPPGPFLFPFAPRRPPSEHRSSVRPFKGGGVYCHRGVLVEGLCGSWRPCHQCFQLEPLLPGAVHLGLLSQNQVAALVYRAGAACFPKVLILTSFSPMALTLSFFSWQIVKGVSPPFTFPAPDQHKTQTVVQTHVVSQPFGMLLSSTRNAWWPSGACGSTGASQ